jgi:methionine-rich copper-binding protein CopC
VVASVRFSERMNALSITPETFYLLELGSVRVPATVTVASDGLSATLEPVEALEPSTFYYLQLNQATDLAGHGASAFTSFTTGAETDVTGPAVVGVSPPEGASGVAVNAPVVLAFDEPLSAVGLGPGAVVLTAGGPPLAGSVALSTDRRSLTFTPASLLATSTLHTVSLGTVTDRSGNAASPFTSSFTTGASGTADVTRPSVVTVSPANNATGVAVTTAIVLTFNEPLDPTSVGLGTIPVFIDGFSGQVSGSYAVSGAVVTFTPLNPLPGNVRVRPQVNSSGVRDLAGNGTNFFQSSFVTVAVTDTTPPTVLMVTPSDGATGVGPYAVVVLTFSESLNASTVNNDSLALFANGVELGAGISRSADNRTVTLDPSTLPANSDVTLVVTSDVTDLSGNHLAVFRSHFTTAPSFDTGRPSVVTQRPGNGASGVRRDISVVLFVNESLDAATVPGALVVSENGVVKAGTATVTGGGRSIEFVPASPFAANALVQIFLSDAARDLSGNALFAYQGSFRTVVDPATQGPVAVRAIPPYSSTGIPRNVVIEVEVSEALDPATVNSTNVFLQEYVYPYPVLPATVSLVGGGRVVRIVPDALLSADTGHLYTLTNAVRDLDGQALNYQNYYFVTGADSDLTGPTVQAVTPPDGAVGVGTNASIRVVFDETINPISVDETTVHVSDGTSTAMACTISFLNGDREVVIVPHSPLGDSRLFTVMIAGVTDRAGNTVTPRTTSFTTRVGPDTVAPVLVRTTPANGSDNVPVNAVLEGEFDEPIDGSSTGSVQVYDYSFGYIAGTASVDPGGRIVRFVPDAPLGVGRTHTVYLYGLRDLAGNVANTAFSFTTGTTADTTPPQIAGVSPGDGFLDVPINAKVTILFDEPIQPLSVDQITLTGGGPVDLIRTFSNANRTLTLTPRVPLAGNTLHTLSIDGVRDLAGNTLAAPLNTSFTTGAGADLRSPTVTTVTPANGATDVSTSAVIEIHFSEPIDRNTVSSAAFRVLNPSFVPIAGTIAVAADALSATFTPSPPLATSSLYRVQVSSVLDLAGNTIGFFQSSFTTSP